MTAAQDRAAWNPLQAAGPGREKNLASPLTAPYPFPACDPGRT
jgi:hypothetical protein